MSDREMIRTIRTQTLARIAELTAQPKPSYHVDGQRIAWAEYLAQLRNTVAWCDAQLRDDEPFEVHSTGFTP